MTCGTNFFLVASSKMACGTPLVAPESGGVTTYAHSGNSWLCQPTPQAFAAAIESIAADPNARAVRSGEALRTTNRYSWPKIAARYFQIYAALHAIRLGRAPEHFPPALFYSTNDRSLQHIH